LGGRDDGRKQQAKQKRYCFHLLIPLPASESIEVSIGSSKPDRQASAANRLATVRHVKGIHQGVAARCFSTRMNLQDMRQIV
jgi:hypothetical protein